MSYYSDDRVELIPNELGIYKLKNSKRGWWYVYIKLAGVPRIRKSLKTTIQRDAERAAKDMYFKLRSYKEEGLPVHAVSWTTLSDKYLSSRDAGETTIRRHKMLTVFFKRFKDIKDIDTADISLWQKWRRGFWTSKEGKQYIKDNNVRGGRCVYHDISDPTLKMEAIVLKSMLKFAKDRGYIQHLPEIPILKRNRSHNKGKKHRRAAFTGREHRMILNFLTHQHNDLLKRSQTRCNQWYRARNEGRQYLAVPIMKNRRMWSWVHMLHKSGLRPQEAANLRWCDIGTRYDHEHDVELLEINITEHSAKTGQARLVYVVEHSTISKGESYLKTVLDEWRSISPFSADTDFIFGNIKHGANPGAKAQMFLYFTKMIKVSFAKHAKRNPNSNIRPLTHDKDGREYSSYSYRHFYATRKLKQGINPYYLCEMMGTSMVQIRNHYGHLLTWDTTGDFIERQGAYNERQENIRSRVVVELQKLS